MGRTWEKAFEKRLSRSMLFDKIVSDAECIDYLVCTKSYKGLHALFPTLKTVPHRYIAGKAYQRNNIYYKEGHWRLPLRRN